MFTSTVRSHCILWCQNTVFPYIVARRPLRNRARSHDVAVWFPPYVKKAFSIHTEGLFTFRFFQFLTPPEHNHRRTPFYHRNNLSRQ